MKVLEAAQFFVEFVVVVRARIILTQPMVKNLVYSKLESTDPLIK